MGASDSQRITKVALVGGAALTIAIGLFIALTIGWYGWLVVGFGVLDLITIPFWLGRMGAASKQAEREAISTGDMGAAPAEAPADPAHNPYARED